MRETVKKYYVQETELCILLALKGVQALYGICLDSTETMTREELYYNLFVMQKKGMLGRNADSGRLEIEEGLGRCVERICAAERFIVLADADELVPETYFYVARDGTVMLEPAGQYDAQERRGAFHLEAVTQDRVQDRCRADGFVAETVRDSVPAGVLETAQACWHEDKETILQHFAVQKLLQEYDVHTQCKVRQCILISCGLDAYLVDSSGRDTDDRLEGGRKT